MPQRKSGVEELRKNRRNQLHNLNIKTDIKKTVKKFLASVSAKNKTEAASDLKLVYKKLDKAIKSNIIEKNTVARRKSRFTRILASIEA